MRSYALAMMIVQLIILSGSPVSIVIMNYLQVNPAMVSPSDPASFTYVVNIWMENQNYGSVIGSSSAPYETQLANTYSTDTSYQNLGASCSCSLPEYMGFFAGEYPCNQDVSPTACPDSHQNIVDLLENAGLSWAGYAENYPVVSGCTTQEFAGSYYARHFVFNYYTDILNSPSRCAKLFNSGGVMGSSSDSAFLAALNQASGWPNFIFFAPNGCNDTHDCGVSTGDTYLAGIVPQIMGSNEFKTGKAALVITWDDNSSPPNIQAGPVVKQHYVSTATYNHYSWLKTLEWNWGLSSIASGDSGASPMTDIFVPAGSQPGALHTSFSFAPSNPTPNQTITFTAIPAGGVPPYNYTWTLGDGTNASGLTVTHAYRSTGSYTVELTVTDSSGKTAQYSTGLAVNSPSNSGTLPISIILVGVLIVLGSVVAVFLVRYHYHNKRLAERIQKK